MIDKKTRSKNMLESMSIVYKDYCDVKNRIEDYRDGKPYTYDVLDSEYAIARSLVDFYSHIMQDYNAYHCYTDKVYNQAMLGGAYSLQLCDDCMELAKRINCTLQY